jgi:hypothetical protein
MVAGRLAQTREGQQRWQALAAIWRMSARWGDRAKLTAVELLNVRRPASPAPDQTSAFDDEDGFDRRLLPKAAPIVE